MAAPVINLSYVGNGPTATGQVISDGTPGPKSKTLYAYGNLVVSSGTWCTTTSYTVNFIDGSSTLTKIPVFVDVFIAGSSGDSTAAATTLTAEGLFPVSVSATGFTLTTPSLVTTAASVMLGFIIAFSN